MADLEPVPEDWDRALAVVAHPDDLEYGAAAAIARRTDQGKAVASCLVEASIALRRDLATAIRRHRPDVVVSINFRDSFGGPSFNHADHRATGIALLDAVRDAANRWVFAGAGGDPWAGVRFALFGASPQATHGTDVTATIDRGVASLREHRAYLDGLGGPPDEDPTAFLRTNATEAGPRLGVEAATTFELIAFR